MRIALAQILSDSDPAANLRLVREYSCRAAEAGARLVVFPEATMCRFGVPLAPIAEPVGGPWADAVRQIATDVDIIVVAGMFTPAGDGRVANTLIAVGPGAPNQPDAHYDKIHLYDAFGFTESHTVAPGREPVVVAVNGVGVGLSTCYDIRFPELYTELARRGGGPGRASSNSGPCWRGPARWIRRAMSPRPAKPIPAPRCPRPGRRARRPEWAAAWSCRLSARWSPLRAPHRSCWSPISI
jgi:predicted amidohydrolase